MKIAIIADQHGELPEIPKCDLMIVSGDVCDGPAFMDGQWRADLSDLYWASWLREKFVPWTRKAPRTIMVGGNHDTALEKFGLGCEDGQISILEDSGCEYGGLYFYGAPWIVQFDNLAFNLPESELRNHWAKIDRADVLICHGPPKGYGDRTQDNQHVGSPSLTEAILRVKPKLVTCGHIHEARGIYDLQGTKIVNSARAFTLVDL